MINKAEKELSPIFKEIDELCLKNSKKVIDAFHKYNISESDLKGTNGYGYNDEGRDKIDNIYDDIMEGEEGFVIN